MTVFFLAARNLVLQRKRYSMIGLAVLIGFTLITILSGVAYGAMETVKAKAARYFSGHVSVTGYLNSWPVIEDPDAVIRAIKSIDASIRTIARRTIYYKTDASIFFGGEMIRQRRLVGLDFNAEYKEISNLALIDGSIDAMLGEDGLNGILISESAARIMGARVGDDVSLYLTTDSRQYNTATLVVRGIFAETSIFGYLAYMRSKDLNRLLQRPEGSATDIAIYSGQGVDGNVLAEKIRLGLRDEFLVYPQLRTKAALRDELEKKEKGEHLAVLSLDAHLAEIKSVLDAFLVITYFVMAVFVLIVMVGILNTYRVIVYERTREIGTMRALGMGRSSVGMLFLFEALGLALLASTCGLVVGVAVLGLLRLVDLGFIPVAGMFTNDGHLGFYLNPSIIWLNLAIMVGGVVTAALGPARKASMVNPADAMRGDS